MNNEWYLWAYEKKTYLHNKVLSFKSFNDSERTHTHCEVCWARFSKHPSDLQNGYYESQSESWICSECYNELASLFGWIIE